MAIIDFETWVCCIVNANNKYKGEIVLKRLVNQLPNKNIFGPGFGIFQKSFMKNYSSNQFCV